MDSGRLAALLCMPDLVDRLSAVEQRMVDVLSDGRYTSTMVEPGLRVVTGGGKRLRPALALAASQLCGGVNPDGEISAAVAVELVQVGSLVHDDLMDHAASRRGVRTVNDREGPSWAILVGDYLLAVAGMEAARVSADVAASLARTIADLADGQSRELATEHHAERTVDEYIVSIGGKTAALLRCACEVGALAGGAEGERLAALARFGDRFGMAFQVVDDVLDVVATEASMGKPVGNDVREGVFTLPVLLTRDADDPRGHEVRALLTRTEDAGVSDRIIELVREGDGVRKALDQARQFNHEAAAALAVFGDDPRAEGLRRLPDEYLEWALGRADFDV